MSEKHFLTSLEGKVIFSNRSIDELKDRLTENISQLSSGYYIISIKKQSPLILKYHKYMPRTRDKDSDIFSNGYGEINEVKDSTLKAYYFLREAVQEFNKEFGE